MPLFTKVIFSNFSCRFLNTSYFFQFELAWFCPNFGRNKSCCLIQTKVDHIKQNDYVQENFYRIQKLLPKDLIHTRGTIVMDYWISFCLWCFLWKCGCTLPVFVTYIEKLLMQVISDKNLTVGWKKHSQLHWLTIAITLSLFSNRTLCLVDTI